MSLLKHKLHATTRIEPAAPIPPSHTVPESQQLSLA